MDSGSAIVVVGADSDLGQELCRVFRERQFPVREWRLFDSGTDSPGDVDDALDEPLLDSDRIDLRGADFVYFCGSRAQVAEWAPRAAAAGVMVVDLTHALAERLDVSLLVPEVNPEAAVYCFEQHMVANPVPGAVALSAVLNVLEQVARLRRVVVSSLEPVSGEGAQGIEELSRQTRNLMSGEEAEVQVFPARVAFNVIPEVGDLITGGRTSGEWLIEEQTRRLLDLPDLPLIVTALRVPTFFGHGYVVNVETETALDGAAARAVLRQAPGILLLEDASLPHATLADAIGADAICVGRVRDDPTVPYGICLWVAIDGMRKGGAVNAVQIAEILLRDARS